MNIFLFTLLKTTESCKIYLSVFSGYDIRNANIHKAYSQKVFVNFSKLNVQVLFGNNTRTSKNRYTVGLQKKSGTACRTHKLDLLEA